MADRTQNLNPPVRTTEEARALASRPRPSRRVHPTRDTKSGTFVLFEDQLQTLRERHPDVNASALMRELLDGWLAVQGTPADGADS